MEWNGMALLLTLMVAVLVVLVSAVASIHRRVKALEESEDRSLSDREDQ
jgi:hypothetical protein